MGFFMMDYYIPSILIVVISWVSFWLHMDAGPPRIVLGKIIEYVNIMKQSPANQIDGTALIYAYTTWNVCKSIFCHHIENLLLRITVISPIKSLFNPFYYYYLFLVNKRFLSLFFSFKLGSKIYFSVAIKFSTFILYST